MSAVFSLYLYSMPIANRDVNKFAFLIAISEGFFICTTWFYLK